MVTNTFGQDITKAGGSIVPTSAVPAIPATSLSNPVQPMQVPQYTPPQLGNFQPQGLTVTSYKDNPDGTTTHYLSDGSTDIVRYQSNPDGSLTPIPVNNPLANSTASAKSAMDASQADLKGTYDALATQPQRQQQLEAQAGIPALNTRLTDLNALDAQYAADLNNLQSQTLQSQLKSEDRLAPMFAITGEQAQAARQQAFLAQNINIQRSTNAAAIAAANGQLALAQNYVQNSMDYEFKPKEYELQYKIMVYEQNRDHYTKAEQRQYDAQLAAENRKLEEDKYNREGVLNVLTTMAKYGAPQTALDLVSKSTDPLAAITAAGQYLQDPAAKLDLEKTKLDMLLTKAQLAKVQKETAQIGLPTPAQAAEAVKTQKAEAAARQSEVDKANQALTIIQQLKTGFMPTTTTSGTSLYGAGSRAVGPISSKLPTFEGATADFERAHDQLRALLSLDNYKLLKGSGAISDKEGSLLSAAASQLDLNMSEVGYRKELEKLDQAFSTIVNKTSTLSPDEQAILDEYWSSGSNSSSLPAANYFRP